MSTKAPLTLLLNAIIERLKNDPRWVWPIYQATGGEPGNIYLYIDASLAPIPDSPKGYQDIQYPIAFDAIHVEPEIRGRISSDTVLEMLEAMENIITLSKYRENFVPFDFAGKRECMFDTGHIGDTMAHITNESQDRVLARQIIGFHIQYNPGTGS